MRYHGDSEEVRPLPSVIDEALRYLGAPDPQTRGWLEALAEDTETRQAAQPRWVFAESPLSAVDGGFCLTRFGLTLTGRTAQRMLADCESAALLVCTLGHGYDRLIRAAQARDMRRAVGLDALGSALVEDACDRAEEELRSRHPGLYLTDRFSPGYGDLPLSLQPQLLAACDAPRLLGVTLTQSLLMLPQKSVSAVIGLSKRPQQARIRGCAFCAMAQNCAYKSNRGCEAMNKSIQL